jgi:4a-hydroxytetrahydrobiopterin dehydratase
LSEKYNSKRKDFRKVARQKLETAEIEKRLAELKDWKVAEEKLTKRFKFENFAKALEFVNRAGAIAEEMDHHPDIAFGWGYAEFFITTHDAGGITARDFALAKAIDAI